MSSILHRWLALDAGERRTEIISTNRSPDPSFWTRFLGTRANGLASWDSQMLSSQTAPSNTRLSTCSSLK